MKNILFVLIGIFSASAFAQRLTDHFVVTNKRDTIYGYLKYTSGGELHNKVTVKVNDTLKLTFGAKEVIYFEEGMNEYYSFVPEGQSDYYFMRVWERGYYELFEWEVPYELSTSKTLIEYRPLLRKKGDKEFLDLVHGDWKKQLIDLFNDYKELADDIKKGKYSLDELGHIIERYNEWKEDQEDGW